MFIDDLIAYCEARSPGFRDEIRGLPVIVFDSNERFAGRVLPNMYRDFQLTMGLNTGPLVFKDRTFRENDLFFHSCHTGADYPSRYAMLALHTPPPEYASALSWFYDLDRCGPEDGPVVAFDDEVDFSGEVTPIADSLQELLCDRAFKALSLEPRTKQLRLDFTDRERMHRASTLLERHGFVTPLPVSRNYWAGEHANGSAAMISSPPDVHTFFAVRLAADDHAALLAIRGLLERELGPALPPLPGDDHSR
jgi:hypothetical protein